MNKNPKIKRIVIAGVPGSGKTTLSRQLSGIWKVKLIELDALWWNPGWQSTPREEFRGRVDAALPANGEWVVDGNYSRVRDFTWGRAEMLIWLDYALSTCLRQLLGRTLARIWDQQELWAGNRESFQKAFFNRDSIFLFAIKMHKDLKNSYPAALAQPEFSHLKVVRLRSPGETACWLRQAQLPEAKKMGSRVI